MRRLIYGALVVCATVACGAAPVVSRPNVLFIVVESLRYDHVGCYGYGRKTTPTIDRLAAEGLRGEEMIATSCWTMPSMMSMFTSTYPHVHNARTYRHRLAKGLTTLAIEMKKGGYDTAGVTANPTTHHKFGFGEGFEFYDDFTILLDAGLSLFDDHPSARPVQERQTSEDVTRAAVKWLTTKRDKKKPFFLHLFYFDPHYDYLPPSPYNKMFVDPEYEGSQGGRSIELLKGKELPEEDRQHLIALYDGEIRYTDDHIGRLLDVLKKQGLYDDTVIIVTADHGEEFWDHGGMTHGHTLYEELVRVPLIIRYPKAVKAGSVVAEQISGIDIMPTILALAELPIPEQCAGLSMMPLLKQDNEAFKDRAVFMESEIEVHLRGIRTRAQKIVERNRGKAREVFSLSLDPHEHKNLAGKKNADRFAVLTKQFEEWKKAMSLHEGSAKDAQIQDLPPELLRQLRSLGYVR